MPNLTGRRNARLIKDGYDLAAMHIYNKAKAKVVYGRVVHAYWVPTTDDVQVLIDGSKLVHPDAIHINSYRALPGRDDLRIEYIEDDLLDLLQRRSRGASC